jgi:TPR repeat protein
MFREGRTAAKDADEAADWFRLAAEQGHAGAQFQLGGLYDAGEGVRQNGTEAVRWYLRAAEQGLTEAQFTLDLMYAQGRRPPKDRAIAVRWHQRAAEQGHADAQFRLGTLQLKSSDGTQAAKAADWYRAAAEQGHADAQYNLGDMHAYGYGVPRDEAEAIRWYRLAADQGNAGAQVSLGFMFAMEMLDAPRGDGRPISADRYWRGPSPQSDVRFRRGVINRYRLEAEQGHAAAQFYVGGIYRRGQGVLRDETEAARWFRLSAEQGYGDAQFALGDMHHRGRGVRQDGVEAHMWLSLAAQSFQDPEDRERSVEARDAVARQMTPDQIAAAQRRARRWMPRPAT